MSNPIATQAVAAPIGDSPVPQQQQQAAAPQKPDAETLMRTYDEKYSQRALQPLTELDRYSSGRYLGAVALHSELEAHVFTQRAGSAERTLDMKSPMTRPYFLLKEYLEEACTQAAGFVDGLDTAHPSACRAMKALASESPLIVHTLLAARTSEAVSNARVREEELQKRRTEVSSQREETAQVKERLEALERALTSQSQYGGFKGSKRARADDITGDQARSESLRAAADGVGAMDVDAPAPPQQQQQRPLSSYAAQPAAVETVGATTGARSDVYSAMLANPVTLAAGGPAQVSDAMARMLAADSARMMEAVHKHAFDMVSSPTADLYITPITRVAPAVGGRR